MHSHSNTNQTTLPLELSSYLPQDHMVFTIEKVVDELEEDCFDDFYHTFGPHLITLKCCYLLSYSLILKMSSPVAKSKN